MDSILKNKDNISFLIKENEALSLEVKELANILRKFQEGKIQPIGIEDRYSKQYYMPDPEKMKRSITVKKDKFKKSSNDLNFLYKMREKYLKEVKYQRIIQNKIY
jgi:hypothetical protein